MKVVAFNPSIKRKSRRSNAAGRAAKVFQASGSGSASATGEASLPTALNAEEFRVLTQAVGANTRDGHERNYFVVNSHSAELSQLTRLVKAGLMVLEAGPLWRGQYVYSVTEFGRSTLNRYLHALA